MQRNTKDFTYNKAKGLLITEISDLGRDFQFEQVYPDAADVGLPLVCHQTGTELVFVVRNIEYDEEGDLKWWELIPAKAQHLAPAQRTFSQQMCALTLQIFND